MIKKIVQRLSKYLGKEYGKKYKISLSFSYSMIASTKLKVTVISVDTNNPFHLFIFITIGRVSIPVFADSELCAADHLIPPASI